MRVVDTSAWIEWLVASPTGHAVERMLPSQDRWVVPTIVQHELVKWLAREVGEDKADQVMAFTQVCVVVSLDTKIALAAAGICASHKLSTADAIVYATAQERGADLLTCDAHFEGLPGVSYLPKKGS